MTANSTPDPIAAFEPMYAAASLGAAEVGWDRADPSPLLQDWTSKARLQDLRTLVVGCGYGRDAELLADLGADVTAFDVAPTAIEQARRRHPRSAVRYVVADLLDPPDDWAAAFDLVLEDITVQAVPQPLRAKMILAITEFVRPGGTLLVLAAAGGDTRPGDSGPPWPLTRGEIEAFTGDGLQPVAIEQHDDHAQRYTRRWRAEFTRP